MDDVLDDIKNHFWGVVMVLWSYKEKKSPHLLRKLT